MPKRTRVDGAVMCWRSRHMPVVLVERIRALAFTLGVTAEEVVNEAVALGLDYMEDTNTHIDSPSWDGKQWHRSQQ